MAKPIKLVDPLETVKNTDWFEIFIENTDLYLCSKQKLISAIKKAPTPEVQGYVFGIFESRQRMAILTGQRFAVRM